MQRPQEPGQKQPEEEEHAQDRQEVDRLGGLHRAERLRERQS